MNFFIKKSGFTLVEMMVVMAIVAMLSVLGIAALNAANNSVVLDRAAERVLSNIRETQNKAFAVATVNNTSPVLWATRVNTDSVQRVYYTWDGSSYNEKNDSGDGEQAASDSGVSFAVRGDSTPTYLYYAVPFGNYYVANGSCAATATGCSQSGSRPYSTIVGTGTRKSVEIVISYRGSERIISVDGSGYANISE